MKYVLACLFGKSEQIDILIVLLCYSIKEKGK